MSSSEQFSVSISPEIALPAYASFVPHERRNKLVHFVKSRVFPWLREDVLRNCRGTLTRCKSFGVKWKRMEKCRG